MYAQQMAQIRAAINRYGQAELWMRDSGRCPMVRSGVSGWERRQFRAEQLIAVYRELPNPNQVRDDIAAWRRRQRGLPPWGEDPALPPGWPPSCSLLHLPAPPHPTTMEATP